MDETKAYEIARAWIKSIGARQDEWTGAIADAVVVLPDPQSWAIADDDHLAVLTERRLYLLKGAVETEHDHLTAIHLRPLDLADHGGMTLSSSRSYVPDHRPGHDTGAWTLRHRNLETPLTFDLERNGSDELWRALAGLEPRSESTP